MNSKALIGVNMLRIADNRPEVLGRCMQAVAKLVADGTLKPTVGGRFTADRIADAHDFLGGRGSTGKVVVTWAG